MAKEEFLVLPSFKMSSRCWEIRVIATAKVRKMKVVNKIGSIVKVQISESNGFCDSDTMVKIIYMVLGMKCISAYEKNDIFGVRVVITIFLHLISNTSYFVKKMYL